MVCIRVRRRRGPVLECDLCRLHQGCAIFAKAPRKAGKQGAIATQACPAQPQNRSLRRWGGSCAAGGAAADTGTAAGARGRRAAMAQYQSDQLAGIRWACRSGLAYRRPSEASRSVCRALAVIAMIGVAICLSPAQNPGGGVAVHFRHLDVHQDGVEKAARHARTQAMPCSPSLAIPRSLPRMAQESRATCWLRGLSFYHKGGAGRPAAVWWASWRGYGHLP